MIRYFTFAGDENCARPFLAITALLGATGHADSIFYDTVRAEVQDSRPKLGCTIGCPSGASKSKVGFRIPLIWH